MVRTGRRIGVVGRKGHFGIEVTPIVERVGVGNNESDLPVVYVIVHKLDTISDAAPHS